MLVVYGILTFLTSLLVRRKIQSVDSTDIQQCKRFVIIVIVDAILIFAFCLCLIITNCNIFTIPKTMLFLLIHIWILFYNPYFSGDTTFLKVATIITAFAWIIVFFYVCNEAVTNEISVLEFLSKN